MKFPSPLIEGVILARKWQFIILAQVDGVEYRCHCPCPGRIGTLDIVGRPCLLSGTGDQNRKTQYTVEAISLNRPEDSNKTWIGINQNSANRYVEYYLQNREFSEMLQIKGEIFREKTIGNSKLDFLVDDIYMEVKTPLLNIQLEIPDYVKQKKVVAFSSIDRFCKHVIDLKESLKSHQRAIMLLAFLYDNPGFKVLTRSKGFDKIQELTNDVFLNGVELWQANFKITPNEVTLSRYFKLDFGKITEPED